MNTLFFQSLKQAPAFLWSSLARWRWGYALGFSVTIFVLSSLPGSDLPPLLPGADKVIHAGIYFCLGLSYGSVATGGWARTTWMRLAAAWLAVAAFGLSDEWHQTFTAGRTAEWLDVAADAVGGLAAVALAALMEEARKTRGAPTRENRT